LLLLRKKHFIKLKPKAIFCISFKKKKKAGSFPLLCAQVGYRATWATPSDGCISIHFGTTGMAPKQQAPWWQTCILGELKTTGDKTHDILCCFSTLLFLFLFYLLKH
jgi:hypothetical protein